MPTFTFESLSMVKMGLTILEGEGGDALARTLASLSEKEMQVGNGG